MKRRTMLIITITAAIAVAVLLLVLALHRSSGRLPRGERLARIMHSPNWRDGQFRNRIPTRQLTSDRSLAADMLHFMFDRKPRLRPSHPIRTVKTDLRATDRSEEMFVWFGHSSYMLQSGGMRFLVDPVMTREFPASLMLRPFAGSDAYTVADMPKIDCIVITHDHWDHLDHGTLRSLADRTGKIVCPLGVGEHLEYWGFAPDRIVELDWDESATLADGVEIHCLTARHFSGRMLKSNRTLWASYMISTPKRNIYLSGDGGYGPHFAEIGQRFAPIDLAVMENGQYSDDWRYIHIMPSLFGQAVADLHPARVVTVHNSKFALSRHPWDEPMNEAAATADRDGFSLLTPAIGEPVMLDAAEIAATERWWME